MFRNTIFSPDPPSANWRRRTDIPWVFVCVLIASVTCAVHYRAFCDDRTDLALPTLLSSMAAKCERFGPAAAAEPLTLRPVATRIGVAVWVDDVLWAPAVHKALDRIESAIGAAASVTRVVHVASRYAHTESATAAQQQQLGLLVMQHVHAADGRRGDLRMHGLSLFAEAETKGENKTKVKGTPRCVVFAKQQAYCALSGSDTGDAEVVAAVASVVAQWIGLESFRDAGALRAWAAARDAESCRYAMRALRQLEQSVAEHPEMPAPEGIRETVARLQALIDAERFAEFARAADDLQFHPLLLPQLYIPFDHALVNHTSILMPVVTMGMLGVRIALRTWLKKYRRTNEDTATKEKDQ